MVTFVYEQKVGDIIRLGNNAALAILSTDNDQIRIGLKTRCDENTPKPSPSPPPESPLELKVIQGQQKDPPDSKLNAEPPLDDVFPTDEKEPSAE